MSVPPLFATQSGTFHYGKVKFEPIDSFAYQAETQQSAKPLTIVVLTDFKIDRPAVLAAINTPGAFVLQSGEKGSFAMLRLVAPEKCGVAGFLAGHSKGAPRFDELRRAIIYGSVLASFCVEAFSLERLRTLNDDQIADRYQMFKLMSQIEAIS